MDRFTLWCMDHVRHELALVAEVRHHAHDTRLKELFGFHLVRRRDKILIKLLFDVWKSLELDQGGFLHFEVGLFS